MKIQNPVSILAGFFVLFTMTLIKTEALLLKKINFKDSSNIIHFYTREQGKVSVIAKGARQMKNQFRGYLEPLNHLSIIYYDKSTREIQILSKVDLLHQYIANPNDIIASSYGNAIMETIDKIVHHNEENEKLFDTTIHILNYLDKNPDKAEIAFILFLFAAIKILGYHIDLKHCHHCREDLNKFYFHEENPHPHCVNCAGKYFDEISYQQLSWLRKADFLDFQKPILSSPTLENPAIISNFLMNYAGTHFDFYPKLHSLELLKYLK